MVFLKFIVVFFFKQKTAYEMRISDWSSDVCSSDLTEHGASGAGHRPNAVGERMSAEVLVSFGPQDRLTGILGGEAHDPAAPILVLPNAGMVPRAGLFRLHIEMSRRLGVRTFRFDLPGVGEAPRILGRSEEHTSELQAL